MTSDRRSVTTVATDRPSPTTQRFFVWCGPAFAVALTIGLIVAGWLPPPRPSESAQHVANQFLAHKFRIRAGVLIMSLGIGLIFPWVAVVFMQLRRIGANAAPLAYLSLISGGMTAIMFMLPCVFWEVAAYRPESRSAELTSLLNDLAWLPFIGLVAFFVVQNTSIAAAILLDRRERPVFPRWVAYANIWIEVMFSMACVDIFFKTGPFAWNGLFSFWLGLVGFGAGYVVMTIVTLKAISEEASEGGADSQGALL